LEYLKTPQLIIRRIPSSIETHFIVKREEQITLNHCIYLSQTADIFKNNQDSRMMSFQGMESTVMIISGFNRSRLAPSGLGSHHFSSFLFFLVVNENQSQTGTDGASNFKSPPNSYPERTLFRYPSNIKIPEFLRGNATPEGPVCQR